MAADLRRLTPMENELIENDLSYPRSSAFVSG